MFSVVLFLHGGDREDRSLQVSVVVDDEGIVDFFRHGKTLPADACGNAAGELAPLFFGLLLVLGLRGQVEQPLPGAKKSRMIT